MCGLVLAMGKYSLVSSELKLFSQMLACDTFRGEHSTGMFSLFRPYGKDPVFKVKKSVDDGFDFVKSHEFMDGMIYKHKSTTSPFAEITETPKALFGHNRHATMGAVNAKNAHPFTHGHITLAHNGTLINQSLLPDHKDFEVDSENICHSIAKIGVDETIQKLHGAYTLIWFNAQEMTINLIRNNERPFHFAETSAGDWFGASEEDMLMWLMKRGKASKTIKRHFEAVVGVHYVFDVSKGCELKEERKLELPRFQAKQTSSYYDYYDRDSNRSHYQAPAKQKGSSVTETRPAATVLEEMNKAEGLNLQVGDRFVFETFECKEYTSRPGWGQVTGWLPQCGEYIEVQCHNVNLADFKVDAVMTATLLSAYKYMHSFHIIGKDVEHTEKQLPVLLSPAMINGEDEQEDMFPDVDGFGPLVPEVKKTRSGELFGMKGWKSSIHNTCAGCGDPILFEEIEECTIVNNYCFCGFCAKDMEEEEAEEAAFSVIEESTNLEEVEIKSNVVQLFDDRPTKEDGWCEQCGCVHSVYVRTGNMSKELWQALDPLCPVRLEFKDKFRPTLTLKKEGGKSDENRTRFQGTGEIMDPQGVRALARIDGLFVDEKEWKKMNECRYCNTRIPFTSIPLIRFNKDQPLCEQCSADLTAFEEGH